MRIPAGAKDVEHSFEIDSTKFLSGEDPFIVYTSALHMHTFGTWGEATTDEMCLGTFYFTK